MPWPHHGTLAEGMALLIPAGFPMGTTSAGQFGKDQSAIKCFFVPGDAIPQVEAVGSVQGL